MQAMQGFIDTLLPAPAIECFNLALQLIQITDAIAVVVNQFHHRGKTPLDRFKDVVIRF